VQGNTVLRGLHLLCRLPAVPPDQAVVNVAAVLSISLPRHHPGLPLLTHPLVCCFVVLFCVLLLVLPYDVGGRFAGRSTLISS
jgi:hypothetical protein